jgi:outer membrane protein assembly factor BamD (BamD/ComL family)
MILSPQGDPYYEWNGYLPPDRYLAQLGLGLGKAALKEGRFADAARLFDRVAAEHPGGDEAAEATYWAAVSRYKGSGNGDDLVGGWKKLRTDYPDSIWRTKQSFTEQ